MALTLGGLRKMSDARSNSVRVIPIERLNKPRFVTNELRCVTFFVNWPYVTSLFGQGKFFVVVMKS